MSLFDRGRRRPRNLASFARHIASGSGGAILCFHSTIAARTDGAGSVHVSIEHLRATIRALSRVARIVPLREMLDRHAAGVTTAGMVALTFDDAYLALAREVGPVLAHEGAHATVFVVTDAASEGRAYWWDRVDELFPLVSSERWRAFEECCGVPDEYRRGQPSAHGRLRPLRQWVLAAFAGRWPGALEQPLSSLERETGRRTTQRSMTFEELDQLALSPAIALGVHTVSHPVLPLLSDSEARFEIEACYGRLRARYENVLPVLAMPYGLFDARTVRIAADAGMTACLTLGATVLGERRRTIAVPRFCITRGHKPWKVALRTLGWWPGVRPDGTRTAEYPSLPSATS